jgi:hypothetical protein
VHTGGVCSVQCAAHSPQQQLRMQQPQPQPSSSSPWPAGSQISAVEAGRSSPPPAPGRQSTEHQSAVRRLSSLISQQYRTVCVD